MDRIIRMIMNRLLRRAVDTGVDAVLSRRASKAKPGSGAKASAAKDVAPHDRTQAQRAREASKRARQAARLTRRLGR